MKERIKNEVGERIRVRERERQVRGVREKSKGNGLTYATKVLVMHQ